MTHYLTITMDEYRAVNAQIDEGMDDEQFAFVLQEVIGPIPEYVRGRVEIMIQVEGPDDKLSADLPRWYCPELN